MALKMDDPLQARLDRERRRGNFEAEGSDWPGVDFIGEVDFDYYGLLLYLKFFL
jgi:hypothetical protein